MTAYIIGAGASKAYEDSPSGLTMPLAKEVFATFNKLNIARNPNVLIGKTLNYLKSEHGVDYENFDKYNEDIEKLYSEVEYKLNLMKKSKERDWRKENLYRETYVELIFIFSSVINSIQNGPVSLAHKNFISSLEDEDSIITFNWDTLIDRALNETGLWHTDSGYIIHPKKIFRDGWQTIRPSKKSFIKLLKLHGSVNWLTSYPQQGETSLFEFSHAGSIEEFAVFEHATKPYPCYQGRYMEGYEPFAFGYYPPNLDFEGKKASEGRIFIRIVTKTPFVPPSKSTKEGLDSIPLIIPPVKHKEYDRFGALFETLWNEAENELAKANQIVILGYSFPRTDVKAVNLMKKACCRKEKMPFVTIVDPYPDGIVDMLQRECDLTNFRVIKECITKKFDFARLKKQAFNLTHLHFKQKKYV